MTQDKPNTPEPDPAPPEGVFAIGPYRRRRRAEEHGLVILSMRLSYEMVSGDHGFYLWIDEREADAVYEQLQKYQRESKHWPPKPLAAMPGDKPAAPLTLVIYVALLSIFFAAQKRWPAIESAGVSDNEAIFNGGQWELPLTALTLHGDIGHLISNVVSGLCFGLLINRTIGAGLGWTLIVIAGYLGNVTNAAFYWPEIHRSLGASTAIFGALGLLVGHAIAARFSPTEQASLKHRTVPLFAGIVILLLTGFSDGNTDILAHVFGFATGVPLGVAGFLIARRWPSFAASRWLFAVPLALIATAWLVAAI